MSDYIKREDALAEFATNGTATVYGIDKCKAIISRLQLIPSSDVVEVVRCKDCKKREHCRTTNTWAVAPSDDWFCADGERAEK